MQIVEYRNMKTNRENLRIRHFVEEQLKDRDTAAIYIQAGVRGAQTRARVQQMIAGVTKIQAHWLRFQTTLDVKIMLVQELIEKKILKIGKVPGATNKADMGTKYHPRGRHWELLRLLNYVDKHGTPVDEKIVSMIFDDE